MQGSNRNGAYVASSCLSGAQREKENKIGVCSIGQLAVRKLFPLACCIHKSSALNNGREINAAIKQFRR